MNTDIRIAVSFLGHRKRKRLRMMLGAGSTDCLLDLWIQAAMNHPDGVLRGLDEVDIALMAGWDDDPKQFVEAMEKCGFLEATEEGWSLHDWEEHQPWVIKAEERTTKAKKAAEARWAKAEQSQKNAKPMPDACSEHAPSIANAQTEQCPSPFLSLPEEERQSVCIRARETAPSAQPPQPKEPDILPPGMEPYDLEFIEFWDAYPKQVGQDAAWERWKILKKSKRLPGLAILLKALASQGQSERWTSDDGRYIPDPANWLAGGHWKDNLPKASEVSARGPRGSPNIQPKTYAQAQDLERRQRAARLLQGGQYGDPKHDRRDSGQTLDTAAQLPERS